MSDEGAEARSAPDDVAGLPDTAPRTPLGEVERNAAGVLQRDLELIEEPFAAPAQEAGLSPAELLADARGFLEAGTIRRFAAILRHRSAGYTHNVMSVWQVEAERSEEVGQLMAQAPEVSHCYERPTGPDWPWTHFAMIHARSQKEAESVVERIRRSVRIETFACLETLREFKKVRVQYFTPETAVWEREHLRGS